MSTDTADNTTNEPDSAESQQSGGKKFSFRDKRVKIFLGVVGVMVVQVLVISLLLPQPASPQPHSGSADADSGSPLSSRSDVNVETVEVPVDTFSCTNSRAAPGSTIHVTFSLVAIVAKSQGNAFDMAANVAHKARVREAVVKVARSSNLDDLNDPNLSTMKRLIREEINKILRKSFVIEVVISDFKTIEQ